MISTVQSQMQNQRQRQVLAPHMRQGLRLLAMSLPELRGELLREMSENPVIDDVEATLEKKTVSECEREIAEGERTDDGYPEPDEVFEAGILEGVGRGDFGLDSAAAERRERFFENQVGEESLEEHLLRQLPTSDIDERDFALAELLIGDLNENGWFVGSIPDLVMVTGESEEKIRAVLTQITELDPPGCGAVTVDDCLRPQLDSIADVAVRERVRKLLPQIRAGVALTVSDPDVLRAVRSLDWTPGRAYRRAGRGVEYVNPEVHAVRCSDGWVAQVDARSLPEIRISNKYMSMLEDPEVSEETKRYVKEKIVAAHAVVEAVEHRQETIEAIAQAIFDAQPGFFEQGLKGLRPLTMDAIAKKVGVHLSTVSRTVNDKYASTPKGTVELRRFFTSGVVAEGGEQVSKASVLERLKDIVAGEDKTHPLSDDALSARLKGEGFQVARRTVAKYRDQLGIPGTAARKVSI